LDSELTQHHIVWSSRTEGKEEKTAKGGPHMGRWSLELISVWAIQLDMEAESKMNIAKCCLRRLNLAIVALLPITTFSVQGSIVQTYTDRSAWAAALGAPIQTEDFNGVPDIFPLPGGDVVTQLGLIGFAYDQTCVNCQPATLGGRVSGLVGEAPMPSYNLYVLPGSVLGFGADFEQAFTGAGLTLLILSFDIVTGTVDLGSVLPSPGTGFLGFISDVAFDEVEIVPTSSVSGEGYFLDNLSFGGQAIPEPGSGILLLLAVTTGAGWLHRLGRRQ
jgi:hypothetical protein